MKTLLQLIIGCLLLCLSSTDAYAIDVLSAQTNDFLVQKIDSFQYNKSNPEVWKYINAYILKAKVRKDYNTLFYGYKEAIYYSNDYQTKVQYADSAIVVAQKMKSNELIVQSFLSKGLVHYQYKKFQSALQNFLLANQKLTPQSSEYLSHKVIFNLALIKFHLKLFNESDELFQKCSIYYERKRADTNHQSYYLNTLYYRAIIAQNQQSFDYSSQLNHRGLKLSQEIQDLYFIRYFTCSIAIDHYYQKAYTKAVEILTKELNYLEKQQDFNTLCKAYFYLGKSFEKLNQNEKSIEYFEKIDQLFNQYEFLDIEFRSAYESLIKDSGRNDDPDQQLYYINQLLKLDQLTQQNFIKLSPIILKEYDAEELIKLKNEVEYKIQLYPVLIIISILGSFIGFFLIYIHFLKNKSIRKKKLIQPSHEIADIPTEIVLEILIQLDEFEANKLFLQSTLTLSQLAKSFNTNSAYLSRIINTHKNTNFSNYLNQLRINFIIDCLTCSDNYHKHTTKDLAELAGFSTSRQFSNAFFQLTSMRPNEFIRHLKHRIKWNELDKK